MGYGQNVINVDSLETAFKKETKTKEKIQLWNTLFRNALNSDYDKASYYNNLLLQYAETTQNDSAFFNAKMYEAYVYRLRGEQDSAIVLAKEAKDYALKTPNNSYLKTYHTLLSTIYIFKDNPDTALFHMEKNMEISKILQDTMGIADAYFTKGHFHGRYNDIALSMQNYIIADSIYSLFNKPDANHASALSNIGTIFIGQNDPESAEKYFVKASKIYKDSNNKYGMSMISFRFAEMYLLQNKHKKAREMANKAMPFFRENNIKSRIIDLNNLTGTSYLYENKIQPVLEHFKEAQKLSLEIKDSTLISTTYFNLGKAYVENKQAINAEPFYLNAFRISQASHDLLKSIDIAFHLSQLYENEQQPNNALKYLKIYQTLDDSLTQKQQREIFVDLEKKYQTEKKEQEIALLKTQNHLAEKQKANQRNIFIATIVIVSLAGLFFFFQFRNRQKTNKKLREIDAAKSTFFTNISHEFRTPLTLIKGSI